MGRIGICSKEGEKWHREVVALISLYMRAMPRKASEFQV
jgi:transposase